jgi:hypothetical protein
MKLFVSHSLKDQELIKSVKNTLEPHGITLFIAEHHLALRQTITQKIETMIRDCDVALILLTKRGFNSKFVQQEIGYIQSCQKPSLQVVQLGLENKITGFNFGRDYIQYDPLTPITTLTKMKNSLLSYWKKIEEQRIAQRNALLRQHFEKIRVESEKRENEAKIAIGILAGLLVLGLAASK